MSPRLILDAAILGRWGAACGCKKFHTVDENASGIVHKAAPLRSGHSPESHSDLANRNTSGVAFFLNFPNGPLANVRYLDHEAKTAQSCAVADFADAYLAVFFAVRRSPLVYRLRRRSKPVQF
jgi:hypothetical protein